MQENSEQHTQKDTSMATTVTEIDGNEVHEFDNVQESATHTWEITHTADGKLRVVVPSVENKREVLSFVEALKPHEAVFGVKKLIKSYTKMLEHQRLVDSFMRGVTTSANTINGIRGSGDEELNKEKLARKYFNSLNTRGLQHQCKVYGLDYASYDEVDQIVNALVEKHMEMFA